VSDEYTDSGDGLPTLWRYVAAVALARVVAATWALLTMLAGFLSVARLHARGAQ